MARLLPPVVSGADRLAPLGAEVAAELGLEVGTPVALAPYDVVATAIGTGTQAVGAMVSPSSAPRCASGWSTTTHGWAGRPAA